MKKKLPYMQFHPHDWQDDTAMLPLDVKGAWIDLLCAMWWNEPRGEITGSYQDFARLLRTTEDHVKEIFLQLKNKNISCITFRNGNVTLVSRRIKKDEIEREYNNLRQKRHREKTKCNGDVTLVSRKNNAVEPEPEPEPYKEKERSEKEKERTSPSAALNDKQKIRTISEAIYRTGLWPEVFAWSNAAMKSYRHDAILGALEALYRQLSLGKEIKDPWPYCSSILKVEVQNRNERDAVMRHEDVKSFKIGLVDIAKGGAA